MSGRPIRSYSQESEPLVMAWHGFTNYV